MKNKDFGKKLQLQRKRKGLKVEQLAELLFVNTGYMRQMEAGEIPSLQLLLALCNALDTSPNQLLGFDSYISTDDNILVELISRLTVVERAVLKHLVDLFTELEMQYEEVGRIPETRFARKLKSTRLKMNLTIPEVAQSCNKSEGYIRTLESGAKLPSTNLLISLCKLLNTTPNYLLSFIDPTVTDIEEEIVVRLANLTDWQKIVAEYLINGYKDYGIFIEDNL